MVDEEQRPREHPVEPSVNRTLEEKAGAVLSNADSKTITKITAKFDKYLKIKNEQTSSAVNSAAELKGVIQQDEGCSVLVKRCPVSASVSEIMNLFFPFVPIVSVKENSGASFLRSVFYAESLILQGEVVKLQAPSNDTIYDEDEVTLARFTYKSSENSSSSPDRSSIQLFAKDVPCAAEVKPQVVDVLADAVAVIGYNVIIVQSLASLTIPNLLKVKESTGYSYADTAADIVFVCNLVQLQNMGQKELYCLSTKLIDDLVLDHDPVDDHDPVVGQLVVNAEAVDDDAVDADGVDGVVGQLVEVEMVGQLVEVEICGPAYVDVANLGQLIDFVELSPGPIIGVSCKKEENGEDDKGDMETEEKENVEEYSDDYDMSWKIRGQKPESVGQLVYFVGNSDKQKEERFYDPSTGKVNTSCDIPPVLHFYEPRLSSFNLQNDTEVFPNTTLMVGKGEDYFRLLEYTCSSDSVVSENVVCEKDVGVEELSVRYAVPGKQSDGSDLCLLGLESNALIDIGFEEVM
ncbi:hypothetical protein DAPPUDRAFT_332988 [Daphnia pulex]|uniref:Uncharacterized protein n=1 Tax=Daphnia pulex TaxID=6669 RepID=E9HRI6_DAPPU|nr:hypothetical protein DAPPUDRAFT_332988 [Daphnia pulex]|eukprot:EFX65657.1 hypothetical protein DAPPUDRAFT_332988 [Daphnia pulex]